MEYVQERVATLHEYDEVNPSVPVESTTVVVPMTERDHARPAAERVLSTLERVGPQRVVVALRASQTAVRNVVSWLQEFDLPTTVLWCTAPQVESLLAESGLSGSTGKGRDVWLALGIASESEYVVVHDVDTLTYDDTHVRRLLFPLTRGYEFSKGYYARVENERLYGRLFRLFFTPLVRTLIEELSDGPEVNNSPKSGATPGASNAQQAGTNSGRELLAYLDSFRYALAGEIGMTGEFARTVRAPRGWGFEVGTLGEAFRLAGFENSAQVDLGVHEHDHRPVTGPGGLGGMAHEVAETLFTLLEESGTDLDYETLPERYRLSATTLVEQYALDAAFNGFEYDREDEREQVAVYARSIQPPESNDCLPAWCDTSLSPEAVLDRSSRAIERLQTTPVDREGRL